MSADNGFNTWLRYEDYDWSFWDGWEIDWGDSNAVTRVWDIKGGLNEIKEFYQNPDSKFSSYGLAGVSNDGLARTYLTQIENLLKGKSLYQLLQETYNRPDRLKELGGGKLDDDEYMWLYMRAKDVNTSTKRLNGFALAKIYDEAINQYLGSNSIYKNALLGRGLTQAQLDQLYTQFRDNDKIRGFDWNDSNPSKSRMIGSVNDFQIEIPVQYRKLTPAVEAKITHLQNSFKTHYTSNISSLKTAVTTARSSQDYSHTSLTSITAAMTSLKGVLDPKTSQSVDTAVAAESVFAKAPVYNLFTTRLGNGIGALINDVATLSQKIGNADFTTVAAKTSSQTYSELSTEFNSTNYQKVRDAYAQASQVIDNFTVFDARYLGVHDPSTALASSMLDIKRLHQAANRFAAFDETLDGDFSFDAFRTSFLTTQADITTFVTSHPEYDANILTESRTGAQARSLSQDGVDIAEPVAVNRIQYDLFKAALDEARATLITLEAQLRSEYTVTISYWWFSQTFQLNYRNDARYTQQVALINQLDQRVRTSDQFADQAEGKQGNLNTLQTGYETVRDAAADNLQGIRDEYEQLTTRINSQFVVLKELSKFAIDVLKDTRQGQAADGFVDTGSLISELIRYIDTYEVLADTPTLPADSSSSDFVFNSSAVVAGTVSGDETDANKSIQLRAGAGNLQKNAIWKIVDGLDNELATHTVQNSASESLASIATSLATQLNGLTGYSAAAADGVITLTQTTPIAINALVSKAASASSVILQSNQQQHVYVTSLTGVSPGGIHVGYDDLESLTVRLSDQADQVQIRDTLGSQAATVTVETQGGDDQIIVHNEDTTVHGIVAALQLDTGDEHDTVRIVDSGTNATDFTNGRLTSNQLTGLGMPVGITYENVDELNIDLGAENDEFLIASTHSRATTLDLMSGTNRVTVQSVAGPTTIVGGDDGNTFDVGSDTSSLLDELGTLNAIAGHLTVLGGMGADTLNLDDAGELAPDTGTLTHDNFTGMGTGTQGISYSAIEDLSLRLGNNSDTLQIYGTSADSYVNASGSGDVVTVGKPVVVDGATIHHTLDEMDGLLTVDLGAAGTPPAEDHLFVTAADLPQDLTGTLTGTQLTGLGMAEGIVYANAELVNITLGQGDDEFNVQSTSTLTQLDAAAGDDHVFVASDANGDLPNQPSAHGHVQDLLGELQIQAGTGNNALRISDYDNSLPADGTIREDQIAGLAPTVIAYDAAGGNFNGGVVVWSGTADDLLRVESVDISDESITTLYTGAGNDAIIISASDQAVPSHQQLAGAELRRLEIQGRAGADVIDASHASLAIRALGGDQNDVLVGGSGDDVLWGDADDDVLLGGDGADHLYGEDEATLPSVSNDVIVGDHGRAAFYTDGTLAEIQTSNFVAIVDANGGSQIYTNGVLTAITTAETGTGGADLIFAGGGSDVVLGGADSDQIDAGSDQADDIVVGDQGQAQFSTNGLLTSISTTDPGQGGDDSIQVGDGNDVVLGGIGDDEINAGADNGRDIVVGDNGIATFDLVAQGATTVSVLRDIRTTDPEQGGSDFVRAGDGDDVVLGGSGADYLGWDRDGLKLDDDSGADVVLGDNGWAEFNTDSGQSILTKIATTDPTTGSDGSVTDLARAILSSRQMATMSCLAAVVATRSMPE